MNPFIIPKSHVNKNRDWYYSFIFENKKNYKYEFSNINIYHIVEQIEEINNYINSNFIIHNFLYFLYRLIESNNLTPNLIPPEGGVPKSGMEFINKNTSKSLGVFHVHLSRINNSVIVWYPIMNKHGVKLKFEYHIHPSDDYEKILTDIYNKNDDGYHFEYGDHFINLKKLLNFDINEKNSIYMTHIKRFYELNEISAFNTRMPLSKEKLPYCVDMEQKGYRISYLNKEDIERFAFDKNFDLDDDVYWLGYDTPEYKYGQKYIVTQEILDSKNKPFYNLYCKCDPSPNDAQQEMNKERNKQILKRHEEMQKKLIPGYKKKKKN